MYIFLQMLDRDKGSRLSQFVIGLLRHIGIYLEGFRCIFTQNGDFKVHAGIQNNIILDFFIFHVFELYVLDHAL